METQARAKGNRIEWAASDCLNTTSTAVVMLFSDETRVAIAPPYPARDTLETGLVGAEADKRFIGLGATGWKYKPNTRWFTLRVQWQGDSQAPEIGFTAGEGPSADKCPWGRFS